MELGFSGPAVGETLEVLLEAVIQEQLPNDRTAQLEYARRMLEKTRPSP